MTDRYGGRYPPRPRSPPLLHTGRTSLPINISGYAPPHEGHLHAVPASRREVITDPRSSNSSVSNAGTITTTYKIKADPPTRGSSVREGSRTRRSAVDNSNRAPVTAVVTTTPRHRPVVHGGGAPRPASPVKNPFRTSEEEYVTIPATSRHGHHHRKHHSSHLDGGDLSRISSEHDGGRLRIAPVREHAYTTRSRPVYTGTVARRQDSAQDDYGDNGYLYTKPGDLAQYDLDHNEPVFRPPRRESVDAGRPSRPNSITGYGDLVPRTFDTRERGPPPSTRGFDKIRAPTWDQPVRMPIPPSPIEPVHRPSPFDPIEPPRRSNSRVRASTYHDREPRRGPREEIYEVKDDNRRQHRRERFDDSVEQRGFGIRTDRPERVERLERPERVEPSHRPERIDRSERVERSERPERIESDRHKDHKSRDVLATGLSIASAALGLNAVKNATRDDREDREDREDRRREESRRDREDRDVLDLNGRDPKERRSRDDDVPTRRVTPPRDTPSPRERDHSERSPVKADFHDISSRDLKERRASKDERNAEVEPREHRRSARSDTLESASDDTSASEDNTTRPRRERHLRDSVAGQAAFNPKDTMDLKALKEALNSKDTPKANSGETRARTPRESMTKDAVEVAEIRKDLKDDRRSREPLASTENKQLRVVSPPREKPEKPEEKPVKGILRQPREKFPEDPAPIREGVAPLKDAKKDGIPPDARWTKISRRLVNPEALEAGKERFEAREDFVIVLRVLSKEEVQGYAEVTQRIRAAREEIEEIEANERRKARRARHERHKRERNGEIPRSEYRQHRRSGRERDSDSHSESDSSETDYDDDRVSDKPKMLEAAPKKKATFEEALMSGGLGEVPGLAPAPVNMGHLKEIGPGQYSGYMRNPPPLSAVAPRKDSK